jgi:Asp-tRNA(Asn)/Glu-tRNA(Gln) amidotransferase A subunit family amidase
MGLSKDDKMSASLPVSVQLIAAPGNEHLLVAAACALHAKGVAVSPTPF